MAIKVISLWANVPDAERLREMLETARDAQRPAMERQQALSYLTGAAKVLANLENRKALADYLRKQIRSLKIAIHYGDPRA